MNARTLALALMCAGVLTACSSDDLARYMALLQGDVDRLTDENADLVAQLSSMEEAGELTDAELAEVRARLAALALGASSEPPGGGPSEECVTIFRVQTCEDGVLHHLDPNTFEWID